MARHHAICVVCSAPAKKNTQAMRGFSLCEEHEDIDDVSMNHRTDRQRGAVEYFDDDRSTWVKSKRQNYDDVIDTNMYSHFDKLWDQC